MFRFANLLTTSAIAVAAALSPAAHCQVQHAEPPDLPDTASVSVGSFGIGMNTIDGAVAASRPLFGAATGDIVDAFQFFVPSSVYVTRVEVVVTSFSSSALTSRPQVSGTGFETVTITGNGTYAIPITALGGTITGTWALQMDTRMGAALAGTSTSLSYQFRFNSISCPPALPAFTVRAFGCQARLSLPAQEFPVDVYRSTNPQVFGTFMSRLPVGATTYVDNSVTPGATYSYRLRAGAAPCANPPYSAPQTVEIPPTSILSAPQMTLTQTSCGVLLTWEREPQADEITVYRMGIQPASATVTTVLPGDATSYLDTSVTDGARYEYGLDFRSPCGNSNVSSAQWTAQLAVPAYTAPAYRTTEGSTASISIGGFPPVHTGFTWRRGGITATDPNGQPIVNGGRFSGATTSTLTIAGAELSDTDTYWCIVDWNGCPQATFSRNFFLNPGCRADFNNSGTISVQDIFDFLSSYFNGCP